MEVPHQYTALILVAAAQHIIKERRKTEMMCGYPSEYGGDEDLIKKIDEFMANTHIQHELKEAMAFAKKMSET